MTKEMKKQQNMNAILPEDYPFNLSDFALFLSVMKEKRAYEDARILDLDRIVSEVKQSEEWEAVKMNILEVGIEHGLEQGLQQGIRTLIETCQELGETKQGTLERLMKKFSMQEEEARECLARCWNGDL